MKKETYFIIVAIIQIILSISVMINAENLAQSQMETAREAYSMFPEDFQETAISMLENSGANFFIFFAIITIILNIVIIITAVKKNILKKKGMMIAFSLICFFIADNGITMILSIVNVLFLASLKRKNPEDFPEKKKKELPKLEPLTITKKDIILAILLILIYFSQILWGEFIPSSIAFAVTLAFDTILLILSVTFFYKKIKRDFKALRHNIKTYLQFIFPRLGIMYIFYIICAWISIILSRQATSVNQEAVESLPLLYMIPMAVIWAPIVEELIFRGALRRLIKNNVIYVFVSALVFGLLHTIGEASLFNMIVVALPYSLLGGTFAYLYTKTDNISTPMFCHAFNNTVAVIMSLL